MERFVKVTSAGDESPIYLNTEHIKAFYRNPFKQTNVYLVGDAEDERWVVKETPDEILKMIEGENSNGKS